MRNTSEIRKTNHFHILQILSGGNEFTVLEMSQKTGLCIATCNTILREMVEKGEALAEKRQLNEVGRASLIYCINKEYKSSLYVFASDGGMVFYIAYSYGGQRSYHVEKEVSFSEDTIIPLLKKYIALYSNISEVFLSVPIGTNLQSMQKQIEDELELSVTVNYSEVYKMLGYSCRNQLNGNTIVLIRENGVERYEFTVYSNLVRMGNPLNQNHVFYAEEAKHVLYVLMKLLSPEEVLFVGDHNVFDFCQIKDVKDFDNFELIGLTHRK